MVDGLRPSGCRQSAVAFSNSSAASCGATSCECTAAGVSLDEKKAGQLNKHICDMMLTLHMESTKKIELLVTSMLVGLNCPTIYVSVYLSKKSIYQSIYPQYLSIFSSAPSMRTNLRRHTPGLSYIRPSIYLSIYQYLSIYLSIHLSIYLSFYLSIYLSI